MDDVERHGRLRRAFHRVVTAGAAERDAVLADVGRHEPDLRDELEQLLSYASVPETVDPIDGTLDALRRSWREALDTPPPTIGRYQIVRQLGAGGMGVVYLAEQSAPRRTVAIKALVRVLASGRQRRRFELEAEILGRLDHPGIARIFEAGCEDDRPYFVMEYVDGSPLTGYARDARLDVRARVGLLVDLCGAVAHAHQRGVVHRDLKPANVLVDKRGRVRVLDFGVAHASGPTDAETLRTHAGELMGTLPYMSPEQLRGDPDLDVRADVYAIGVVAYELLAGRRPLDVGSAPFPAAIRQALEFDPPPLRRIVATLPADLEIIVGKAMRKRREERYTNVVELESDFRRWLAHEPITARPPSTTYQLRKFAERNRGVVIGAIGGMALLLVTIAVVGAALVDMRRQRGLAQTAETIASDERDAARHAGDVTRRQRDAYLSVIAFSELDADGAAALVQASADADDVHAILGHAFAARGWFRDARVHLEAALAGMGDRDADADLETRHELLWMLGRVDRETLFPLSELEWREVSERLLRHRHAGLAEAVATLESLAPDRWSREFDAAAVVTSLERVCALTAALPDDDVAVQFVADRLEAMMPLYSSYTGPKTARSIMEAAVAMRRRHLLETSLRVLWARALLVDTLLVARQPAQAAIEARRAIAELVPILPEDHAVLATFRLRLAEALFEQGDFAEALALLRDVRPRIRAGFGAASREFQESLSLTIRAKKALGDLDGLADLSERYLASAARVGHRPFWMALDGRFAPDLDELDGAAGLAFGTRDPTLVATRFDRLFTLRRQVADDGDDLSLALADVTTSWVRVWLGAGGWSSRSRAILRETERTVRAGAASPTVRAKVCILGITHEARAGNLGRAEAYFREGRAIIEGSDASAAWLRPRLMRYYGEALLHHGRHDEAEAVLADAAEGMLRRFGESGYRTQYVRTLQSVLRHAIDPAEARAADLTRLERESALQPMRPRALGTAAWLVCRVPGHAPASYARAHAAAERAYRVIPATWQMSRVRAMAQYRVGRYEDAIAAARLTTDRLRDERPEMWAIEAMAGARLGDPDARAALERAEDLLRLDEFRWDAIAAPLIAEARRGVRP